MNLNQKFAILFWLKKDKTNKQGLAPIWTRITIDNNRAEFSAQKQIHPDHWDSKECVVTKRCPDAKPLNEYLMLLKAELTRRYNILLTAKEVVTACDVRDNYKALHRTRSPFSNSTLNSVINLLNVKTSKTSPREGTSVLKFSKANMIDEKILAHLIYCATDALTFGLCQLIISW